MPVECRSYEPIWDPVSESASAIPIRVRQQDGSWAASDILVCEDFIDEIDFPAITHETVSTGKITQPQHTAMTAIFDYLVRFVDSEGHIVYGNIPAPRSPESLIGTKIAVLLGSPVTGFKATNQEKTVGKVCVSDANSALR